MTVIEIYNALLAGKKLQVEFAGPIDAETMRVRIHHYKTGQEKYLLGLGMMTQEEVPMFSFRRKSDTLWHLQFIKQKPLKEYEVVILDDSA